MFQYHFQPILFLSETPVKTVKSITVGNIRRLNEIAVEVVLDLDPGGGQIHVFDAFLALQEEYRQFCLAHDFPEEPIRTWACGDTMHSGYIVNDHYAQMLLNHVCR